MTFIFGMVAVCMIILEAATGSGQEIEAFNPKVVLQGTASTTQRISILSRADKPRQLFLAL